MDKLLWYNLSKFLRGVDITIYNETGQRLSGLKFCMFQELTFYSLFSGRWDRWVLLEARVPMDVPGNESHGEYSCSLWLEKTQSGSSLRMKYMRNIADSTRWPVPFIFCILSFPYFYLFCRNYHRSSSKNRENEMIKISVLHDRFSNYFLLADDNSLFKIQSNFYRFKFKLASRLLFCSFFVKWQIRTTFRTFYFDFINNFALYFNSVNLSTTIFVDRKVGLLKGVIPYFFFLDINFQHVSASSGCTQFQSCTNFYKFYIR